MPTKKKTTTKTKAILAGPIDMTDPRTGDVYPGCAEPVSLADGGTAQCAASFGHKKEHRAYRYRLDDPANAAKREARAAWNAMTPAQQKAAKAEKAAAFEAQKAKWAAAKAAAAPTPPALASAPPPVRKATPASRARTKAVKASAKRTTRRTTARQQVSA